MIVISDLDGTLLDSHHRLSPRNRRTLDSLADARVVRVVATGRSLYSARQVLDDDFPIDYLVFSSGAGILDWASKRLILAHDMPLDDAMTIAGLLMERALDFMLHHGTPDNHHFYYFRSSSANPDFDARCARYGAFAAPWPEGRLALSRVSQLLAVEPVGSDSQFDDIAALLPGYKVILTTSPLDQASRWIEIFPTSVSKAIASAWLCAKLGLDERSALAIGNDFNDIDLLDWSSWSRVVANAPAPLKDNYARVASNDEDGFSEAVEGWRRSDRSISASGV